jgi:hypothetical protein
MSMLLLLAACGGAYTVEGQLEDGVFGGPIGGFDLTASADDPTKVALACQTLAGKANDDGSFSIDGLCAGTTYTVTAPNVLLPDLHQVPDGGFGGPKSGKAYRAPGGDGFYTLTKGDAAVKPADTNAGFKKDKLPDGSEVRYPGQALKNPPLLAGDTVLIATGAMTEVPFLLLEPHPEGVQLAEGRLPAARILGDVVAPDAAHLEAVVVGDTKVHIYKPGALPDGRYALIAGKSTRMLVIDAGTQQPARLEPAPAE